jgi:hypothetical protein
MNVSVEDEAAAILAEIARLESATATATSLKDQKGSSI